MENYTKYLGGSVNIKWISPIGNTARSLYTTSYIFLIDFFHNGSKGKLFRRGWRYNNVLHGAIILRFHTWTKPCIICVMLYYTPRYMCLSSAPRYLWLHSNSLVLSPPLLAEAMWKYSITIIISKQNVRSLKVEVPSELSCIIRYD